MERHPDSPAFVRYLKDTIHELISPLEEIEWEYWEEGDDAPDAYRTIKSGFWLIGGYFANADGDISNCDAAFLQDIEVGLGREEFGLPIRYVREEWKSAVSILPECFLDLKMPTAVHYLQQYDNRHGTDYAMRAKSMFFRYANAVAKADGSISPDEEQALSTFKDLLFDFQPDYETRERVAGRPLNTYLKKTQTY